MTQHASIACLEYEIGARSRYLVQIPHNSSVNITMLPCLMVGATIAFADSRSFDPARFADTVAGQRISHTFLVPTQLMRIIDQLPAHDSRLRSLLTLGYGSSPISPDRLRELLSRYGPIFIQLYGMAEIASIGTLLRKPDHVRALADMPQLLRSCGRPSLGVDVRVVDDEGRPVAPGERGEVVFRGVHLMRGYYRDPERTAETLRSGRVYSGDIGEQDADGYLYIVDRKKNIIIRGGQNIVPTEIENTLFAHPAVLEAAVVGAPDPVWGERIVAVVALREGSHATPTDLTAHVASSGLTSFKRPEEVRIVPSLPKNPVGKIDKKEIRGWFWQGDRSV
jgi:acyl-CoA synthetase (AMP-forming)/AMP-acid ligase II